MKLRHLLISPTKDITPHPTEGQEMIIIRCGGDYVCDWRLSEQDSKDPTFTVPLLSKNMKDKQHNVSDVGCQSQGTPMTEVSSVRLNTMELLTEMWDKDLERNHDCRTLVPEKPIIYFNSADIPYEDWELDSERNHDCRTLVPEKPIIYFNSADIPYEDWELDSERNHDCRTLVPEKPIIYFNSADIPYEDWELDSERNHDCRTLVPEKPIIYFNSADIPYEDWELDSERNHDCRTLVPEKPIIYFNSADIPYEDWELDSERNHDCRTLVPEKPIIYFNSADIPYEDWELDSERNHDCRTLVPEKPIIYFNSADIPYEDWELDSERNHDCRTLVPEKPIIYFNSADIPYEDWELDYEANSTLTEKFTTYMNRVDLDNEEWTMESAWDGSLMPVKSTNNMNTVEVKHEDWDVDYEVQEMTTFHLSCLKFLTDPHAENFVSQYTLGNLLGTGGFGSVYEGICKKDGQQVAIKYIPKEASNMYITLPGESCKLPLEVALMKAVSKPPHCENVLQLLDWFDMPDYILLVLERPIPCVDVFGLRRNIRGIVPESLAKLIILQVIKASLHCQKHGVFHRDIKVENLLFNTTEVKLIDFGCGDLWKDTAYHGYEGTPVFQPPEWILHKEYYAEPMTVWSIGILLFSLVCGTMPFLSSFATLAGFLHFRPGLSKACCDLIKWCLEQDQTKRPSLMQLSDHNWFTEDLEDQVLAYT